jgi:hypothetical protein
MPIAKKDSEERKLWTWDAPTQPINKKHTIVHYIPHLSFVSKGKLMSFKSWNMTATIDF